jgi:uncharacterized membrane protein
MFNKYNPRNYFTSVEFAGIKRAVQAVEARTNGEIRVSIRGNRKKSLSLKDQALSDFAEFGLKNTRDQTGILILLILKKKEIQVLADKGINDKVPEGYWDGVVKSVSESFKKGEFYQGLCDAIEKIGNLLCEKFPCKSDDSNELPDDIIIN